MYTKNLSSKKTLNKFYIKIYKFGTRKLKDASGDSNSQYYRKKYIQNNYVPKKTENKI